MSHFVNGTRHMVFENNPPRSHERLCSEDSETLRAIYWPAFIARRLPFLKVFS